MPILRRRLCLGLRAQPGLEQARTPCASPGRATTSTAGSWPSWKKIHARCVEHGTEARGFVNYVRGAKRAGFEKVACAMLAYGVA